jgi:hypothetical protein
MSIGSAEVFDPATGNWTVANSLTTARNSHTATLLPTGRVVVTGGFGDVRALASTETYDSTRGTWTLSGRLSTERLYHTATPLPDGNVLVTGGVDITSPVRSLETTELYDAASGEWKPSGNLIAGRQYHTATLLPTGKVLVAGGIYGQAPSSEPERRAEICDPAGGTWTETGSLLIRRRFHTATLLANGKVLVAGGAGFNGEIRSTAELYDPSTGIWTATGDLTTPRAGHTATLLSNGMVLSLAAAETRRARNCTTHPAEGGPELLISS